MNPKLFSTLALALALCGPIAHVASASDALVQLIPSPDLSKLPAARADLIGKDRAEFEKAKVSLVGPTLAQAYALIGSVYARNGFYDAATVAFDDAIALAPGDGRWLYARGLIARAQKRDDAALGYFERALTQDKAYLPIRIALASSRIQRGELDAARKVLEEYVATQTAQPVPYALLGDIALRQKRYPDAVAQLNLALKADPKATRLYAQLADAYAGAGDATAAAQARAKAGSDAPQLGDPIGIGMMEAGPATAASTAAPASAPSLSDLDEAELLLAVRQYDSARGKLDAVLKQKPNDIRALNLYARVEAAAGNVAQAKLRANAAVSAAPSDAAAQLTLGVVSEFANEETAAQRAYEKAISLDANLAEARQRLGQSLMRERKYEQAAAQYRGLAQGANANGAAWAHLVAADVATGSCAEAIKDINAGLAKDPNNGALMQLFVRTTSTCASSRPEEKKMALDYGSKLYKQTEMAPVAEAYALALAANGKWDDAVKTQQAAMFVLVRNGHKAELADYRQFLVLMQAHKLPDRPWPASSELFNPPRSTADAKAAATPAK